MKPTGTLSDLEECAARWAVRVDAGPLSATEKAELEAWTGASPRHAGAFARAMAANAYFDRAAALGAQDLSPAADRSTTAIDIQFRRISRRTWIGGATGAIAAALVAAVGLRRWMAGERFLAPRGSVRRTALADGSAVTLNTMAEIRVALQPQVRHVDLIAGEVNFDIAKDATRPFIVEAGPVRVRVVGTSFIVRRQEDGGVAVTVREGIVEVGRDGEAPARLMAGDRLVLSADASARRERLSVDDIDRAGLWQRGEIDLTGMTLGEAIREFARYSDRRILLTDANVARLKVAGVFSTSDPAGFAQAAALAQGLKAEIRADGAIVLRAR